MTGEVLEIHAPKLSRNGNTFIRITFNLSNGKWAKTDVCPNYRNYKRWKPVIEAGKGTFIRGLIVRGDSEVNADSFPEITTKAIIKTKDIQKTIRENLRNEREMQLRQNGKLF